MPSINFTDIILPPSQKTQIWPQIKCSNAQMKCSKSQNLKISKSQNLKIISEIGQSDILISMFNEPLWKYV